MGLKLFLKYYSYLLWRQSDWNSGNVYSVFLSESFTIDVFAPSKFISNEQIAWQKDHVHRIIERFFSLLFFSFYACLRLLLAKLKRPVFMKFSKDIQIHNKIFNKTRFVSQFSNKRIHHWNLTRIYEIFKTVIFWTAEV